MSQKPINITSNSSVFAQIEEAGHEQIVFCQDKASGLKAIIGIHNTVLGPALGGTRRWDYVSDAEALTDVLRLSRGMTFKNAIAGLNLGGGKAVIFGNPRSKHSEVMLRSFGKFIQNLNGQYITAEDVGMSVRAIEYIGMETKYVAGMPHSVGGSGDPSPFTALGVYMGIKAAAKKAYGSESLQGKRIAVQGTGNVGRYLINHLSQENANVFVTDIFDERVQSVVHEFGVTGISPDEIYELDMDIYAPCALGATINDETLSKLKCQIIAGGANNQLADEKKHGDLCRQKEIIYVPDFLINAGGVINIATEVNGHYNQAWARAQVENLYHLVLNVLEVASSENRNAQEVAMELALKRIQDIARIKARYVK